MSFIDHGEYFREGSHDTIPTVALSISGFSQPVRNKTTSIETDSNRLLVQSDTADLAFSLLAAHSVCQAGGRKVPLCLMNIPDIDIKFHAGQKVGLFRRLNEIYSDPALFTLLSHSNINITFSTSTNAKLCKANLKIR